MKNVFIYVSDALRLDHLPESIAEEGKVIPTLTPGAYTPICFSSLVTGNDPRNHSVRSFYDTLKTENVFDLFDNHCYFDHPEDSMCKNVFGNYTCSKEIEDMEEPFFYVERALDTHEPYGKIKHGNSIPEDTSSDKNLDERYKDGVSSSEKHFWEHVEKLKELGLYEDTLIIFTSDHGDLLNEKRALRTRKGHNKPMCPELNVVPTVFINHNAGWDRMRTIDIVPTTLSMIDAEYKLECDGVDLNEETPETGYSMLQINTSPLITTGCSWKWNGKWERGPSRMKTDLATLTIDLVNPLRKRLRNSKLAELVRPENADEHETIFEHKQKEPKEKDTEGIEF